MALYNLWGYRVHDRRAQDERLTGAKEITSYAFQVCRGAVEIELCVDLKVTRADVLASVIGLPGKESAMRERARYLARVKASMMFKEYDNQQRG
jgi:hypothetical protein